MPKSSYYEWKMKLAKPINKDKEIRKEITTIVEASKGRYGYRRVTMVLKNKGFNINHKKVLRIMREESLLCSKFKTRSRKYSCLDNSPMENFFGILKQEMYYGVEFKSYDELVSEIEKYIKWYNEDRIKIKLNGMSPVMYRLHSA